MIITCISLSLGNDVGFPNFLIYTCNFKGWLCRLIHFYIHIFFVWHSGQQCETSWLQSLREGPAEPTLTDGAQSDGAQTDGALTDGALTDEGALTNDAIAESLQEEVVMETQAITDTMTAMIASCPPSVELLAAMRKFKARLLQAQRTTSGTISLLSSVSHLSLRRYIII